MFIESFVTLVEVASWLTLGYAIGILIFVASVGSRQVMVLEGDFIRVGKLASQVLAKCFGWTVAHGLPEKVV